MFFFCLKDGVKAIQDSIQNNQSLLELDLRLTDAGQESEHNINKVLRKNAEIDRTMYAATKAFYKEKLAKRNA